MEFGPKTWAQVVGQPPKYCTRANTASPGKMSAAQPLATMTLRAPRQAAVLAGASTAAQSTGRHTHSQPRERPSMEDLPRDVLEAVLGFLDRETLCTARVVSQTFCAAASMHICSLTFRKPFQTISSRRFPRLSYVTVHRCAKWGELEQVEPSLWNLMITLGIQTTTYEDCQVFVSEALPQIALMPKLQELNIGLQGIKATTSEDCQVVFSKTFSQIAVIPKLRKLFMYMGDLNEEFDVGAMAGVLCHCTNLESIRLAAFKFDFSRGMTIASMTSLTHLSFRHFSRSGQVWSGPSLSPDFSWLKQATALKNLRALSLVTPSDALPLIGDLTGLTTLSWVIDDVRSSAYSIAPLTRLTNLKSVGLLDPEGRRIEMSESNVDIACSLGLGSLVELNLRASASCGKFLTCQTALTQLTLAGGKLCNLRHITVPRLEVLQSLVLLSLASVDAEGLSSLCKATRLTQLHIGFGAPVNLGGLPQPHLRLSQALGGLTQLRSLVLSPSLANSEFPDYELALRPLTGLTFLLMSFARLDEGGLQALLSLTGLRVLDLTSSDLTDDMVPELGILTNLERLKVSDSGVTSLASVTDVVNPLRQARGWPPMDAMPE